MKTIKESVNEGAMSQYLVAFNDFKDNDGFPISCTVLVYKSVEKEFEKFLKKEEGNIFAHADGGSVEY